MPRIKMVLVFLIGITFLICAWSVCASLLFTDKAIKMRTAHAQQTGELHVIIGPEAAIEAGAQWRVDGGAWRNSGSKVSGLSVGNHTVSYKSVFGWVAPSEDTVSIQEDKTTGVTGVYSGRIGSIIRVPLDYPNIQAGIDAASDGDIVLVDDGTYCGIGNKNLDFSGKAIKVTSENGADNTIIDCERNGRGFCFHSDEGGDSVVSGFTITNGLVDRFTIMLSSGAGIYCANSSPTIINCIIKANIAYDSRLGSSGGGIYCSNSFTNITNCTITENSARAGEMTAGLGGGIYCSSSSPKISNCTITKNNTPCGGAYSNGLGGGIYCTSSSPIITSCTIAENSAAGCDSVSYYYGRGGGLYCQDSSSPILTNCIIKDNIARGNTLSDGGRGGGIYSTSPGPSITNCTIIGNDAEDSLSLNGLGGGIFGPAKIINSIFWDNSPDEIRDGESNVTYSDVRGGYFGQGNIDSDPLFVGNSDCHLTSSSPCIDSGDNDAFNLPSTDKDGNPRIMGGTVDMGAYEFQPVTYVDKDDETCGGKTPCYTSIQEAMDASSDQSIIKIEAGNYEEDIALSAPKTLSLKGGYDIGFTTQESYTTVKGSLVVSDGKVRTSKIKVHFQK